MDNIFEIMKEFINFLLLFRKYCLTLQAINKIAINIHGVLNLGI